MRTTPATVLACLVGAFAAAGAVRGADAPAVPPLVAGGGLPGSPKAFAVSGKFGPLNAPGLRFRYATDGERELCVLSDAADGTPIVLSDGHQTLVYEVLTDRVAYVPRSRVVLSLEWPDPAVRKYEIFFKLIQEPTDDKQTSRLRLDSHLAVFGAEFKRLDEPDLFGAVQYVSERPTGTSVFESGLSLGGETLRLHPDDPSRFTFSEYHPSKDTTEFLLVDASRIGGPVPEPLLTFPDIAALEKAVSVRRVGELGRYAFPFTSSWTVKFHHAVTGRYMTGQADPDAEKVEAIRVRDEALGERYRAALTSQGIWFDPTEPMPTPKAKPPLVAEKPERAGA